MSKIKRNITVIAIILIMSLSVTSSVLSFSVKPVMAAAGSWVGTAGTAEDYNGFSEASSPVEDNENKNGFKKMIDKLKKNNVEWIDRTLGYIPGFPAMIVHYNLAKAGTDIDGVILGRVKTGETSLFSFELATGNPYGYAGAIGYNALRAIVIVFFGILMMLELAKQGISLTAEGKNQLKEYTYNFIISVCALFLVPHIVDLLVYLRDSVLIHMAGSLQRGTAINLVDTCWNEYAESPGIFNGILYATSVLMNIAFMAIYAGIAMASTALFAFFPVFLLLGFKDKSTISTWFKAMVTQITVPCIDFFLMFIPIYIWEQVGTANKADNWGQAFVYRLLEIMVLVMVVPMRNVISSSIGLGGGAGAEAGISAFKTVATTAGKVAKLGVAGAGIVGSAGLGAAEHIKQKRRDDDDAKKEKDTHDRQAELHGGKLKTDLDVNASKPNDNDTGGGGGTGGGGTGGGGGGTGGGGTGGGGGSQKAPTSQPYNIQRAQNLQQLENARNAQAKADARLNNAQTKQEEAQEKVSNLRADKAEAIAEAKANGQDEKQAAKAWNKEHGGELKEAKANLEKANAEVTQAETSKNRVDEKVNDLEEKENVYAAADKVAGGSGETYGDFNSYNEAMTKQAETDNAKVDKGQDINDRLASLQNYNEPDRLKSMSDAAIQENATAAHMWATQEKSVKLKDASTGKPRSYHSKANYAKRRRQAAVVNRMSKSLANFRHAAADLDGSLMGMAIGDERFQRSFGADMRNLSESITEADFSATSLSEFAYEMDDMDVKRGGDYIPSQAYVINEKGEEEIGSGARAVIQGINKKNNPEKEQKPKRSKVEENMNKLG